MEEQKRLRFIRTTPGKKMLGNVFILCSLVILVLPFWTIFQDILTRIVIHFSWFRFVAEVIVPYELKVVGVILTVLHFPVKVGNAYIEFTRPDKSHEAIYLIWNCVGWQSMVFLIITLITGLSGKHRLQTKIETIVLGILGTYLVNLFRLVLVIIMYYFFGRFFGLIFHDYISNLLTLIWLFFYWWFVYNFVLEDKNLPQRS